MKTFYDDLIEKLSMYPEEETKSLIANLKTITRPAFIVGNGGSAAIASHVAEDFTKVAGVCMKTYNDVSLMSCLANDYGWDKWVEQAIQLYSEKNTVGIFISSSGTSPNIINGCKKANEHGIYTVTLTGFNSNNPLRQLGSLNFWVPSKEYNIIELVHEAWLLSVCDQIAIERRV